MRADSPVGTISLAKTRRNCLTVHVPVIGIQRVTLQNKQGSAPVHASRTPIQKSSRKEYFGLVTTCKGVNTYEVAETQVYT